MQRLGLTIMGLSLLLVTALFFLPLPHLYRFFLLLPIVLFLVVTTLRIRRVRSGIDQLNFETQFIASTTSPDALGNLFRPDGKIWQRSNVVQSVVSLGFGAGMIIHAGPGEETRLRLALHKLHTPIRWMQPVGDIFLIFTVLFVLVIYLEGPGLRSDPLLKTIIYGLLSIIMILDALFLYTGMRFNERLSRLEFELATWTRNLIDDTLVETPYKYRREDHFVSKGWSVSGSTDERPV